jgi:hypothetical protein
VTRTREQIVSIVMNRPLPPEPSPLPIAATVGKPIVYEGIPGAPEIVHTEEDIFTDWPDDVPGFKIVPFTEEMKAALDAPTVSVTEAQAWIERWKEKNRLVSVENDEPETFTPAENIGGTVVAPFQYPNADKKHIQEVLQLAAFRIADVVEDLLMTISEQLTGSEATAKISTGNNTDTLENS